MGLWRMGFPVIIDNMMNLELLFFASRLSGSNHFAEIAVELQREPASKPFQGGL